MAKQTQDIIIANGVLADRIYTLRDENIMLDRDLAELYGVETHALKQAVRRNIEKFPQHWRSTEIHRKILSPN